MELNKFLEVILDDGEAVISVSKSIEEEGHEISSRIQNSDQSWTITIRKLI
jgi:TusA-related sulfurtransferase